MNRNSKKNVKTCSVDRNDCIGRVYDIFRDVSMNTVRNTDLQTEQQAEQQAEQQMEEQAMIRDKHDYSMTTELPDEENLSESDTFNGEKKDVYVYFENTAELDAGNLPLAGTGRTGSKYTDIPGTQWLWRCYRIIYQ